MEQVRHDLEVVSGARVFFGHHSVGFNILDGVRRLADKAGVPLRIEKVDVPGPVPEGPGLFHGVVGENLDPQGKIDAFAEALGTPGETRYDLATVKLCYVDLDEDSKERDPRRLFDRYVTGMEAIKAAHPDVTILHATMPLRAEPPGRKTRLKRLLGMSTEADATNIARNDYNLLIRERYAGPGLIDIAHVEATHQDGSLAEFAGAGRENEMLALEYTSDGGHLNEAGREWVAAAFLHQLAEALRARQPGS